MQKAHESPAITQAEVHEALRCLYDSQALGQVALAQRLPELAHEACARERARRLRGLLLDAIEFLQPARPSSFRSPAARSYDVMALHFVEGLPLARVAEELSISERQAYRDLQRAEDSLAELLGSTARQGTAASLAAERQGDSLEEELQGLPPHSAVVDVASLVEDAVRTVAPLSEKLCRPVLCDLPRYPLSVTGDRVLLRLTLVKMLTAALCSGPDGPVRLQIRAVTEEVRIELRFAAAEAAPPRTAFAEVESMARAQRLRWDAALAGEGVAVVILALPRRRRRLVLVLEDNASAVELYRRYLAQSDEWELRDVPDPETLLEQARSERPAVVVLDVLLPQCDGWQVLQMLRAQPETESLPVLVCSVFGDEELSTALGANVCLKKPTSQAQFLAGLQACLESHNRPARPPRLL